MTSGSRLGRGLTIGLTVGVAVLVVAAVLVIARVVPITGAGADRIDRWLAAMADPTGDRGWSLLAAGTRDRAYGGDEAAYRADVDAVDWSEVVWAPATGYSDDGYFSGLVALRSHPSTLPRFIVERRLAGPGCIDELPHGLHVLIPSGWDSGISAGAGPTGSERRCAEAFYESPGPHHAPFDLVGAAWGSPGPNQRVGVVDGSGLVEAFGPGREDPPLDGPSDVSTFEHRQLAVTWLGSPCDANTTLHVTGDTSRLAISVERGIQDPSCAGEVIYEVVLDLREDIPADQVDVKVTPLESRAAP